MLPLTQRHILDHKSQNLPLSPTAHFSFVPMCIQPSPIVIFMFLLLFLSLITIWTCLHFSESHLLFSLKSFWILLPIPSSSLPRLIPCMMNLNPQFSRHSLARPQLSFKGSRHRQSSDSKIRGSEFPFQKASRLKLLCVAGKSKRTEAEGLVWAVTWIRRPGV